jgi:putative ABC transport system permease protein
MFAHILFGASTAAEAVGHNKLRASLSSLGILFGVASVIAMLAPAMAPSRRFSRR